MSQDMLDPHLEWFSGFASGYFTGDEKDRYNIRLKIDHSLRVLKEAEAIAAGGGLSDEMTGWLRLCALYHDLGRFPQYARYKTFSDPASTDHARLSVATLKAHHRLDGLDHLARRRIMAAVVVHNKKFVPEGLEPVARELALMLRDSDKLDIVRVMLENFDSPNETRSVVVLHLADEPGEVTEAILDQVVARSMADYRRMRYINDFRLLLTSWIYDLNTPTAKKAFLDRDYVPRLIGGLPPLAKVREARKQLLADLANGLPAAG